MTDAPNEKKPKINYPANSQKAKDADRSPDEVVEEGEKKVKQITSGSVVQRKKPLGKKIAETFAGDDAHSVGSYILFDVIIPATKNLVSDMVREGIDRLLFGDSKGRSRISSARSNGHTSYSKMYTGSTRSDLDRPGGGRQLSDRSRRTHDFTEVILDDRGEAEQVLDTLRELIDNYDIATVTDLYDLVGITGSYVDDKWGWADLRAAEVRRIRDGYLLDLPRAMPID